MGSNTDPMAPTPVSVTADPIGVTRSVLARHAGEAGALLPILHDVQDELGHVPSLVVPEIARALNLSRAEVHGVVTYYHHFRSEPAGRTVVQICRAEACQSMGAEALLAHARERLAGALDGHGGARSSDGRFSVEPVYCLGLCASSPAMRVGEQVFGRVTPMLFDRVLAEADSTVIGPAAAAVET